MSNPTTENTESPEQPADTRVNSSGMLGIYELRASSYNVFLKPLGLFRSPYDAINMLSDASEPKDLGIEDAEDHVSVSLWVRKIRFGDYHLEILDCYFRESAAGWVRDPLNYKVKDNSEVDEFLFA